MLSNFTFNKIIMMVIGLGFAASGIWFIISPGSRIAGVGLVLTGIGNVLFGLTDGFADMSPNGRIFYRIAILAYCAGLPILAYSIFKLL